MRSSKELTEQLEKRLAEIEASPEFRARMEDLKRIVLDISIFGFATVNDPIIADALIKAGFKTFDLNEISLSPTEQSK